MYLYGHQHQSLYPARLRARVISGESGNVSGATVQSWRERLPDIVKGYSARDIRNYDETCVFFWRALSRQRIPLESPKHVRMGSSQSKG